MVRDVVTLPAPPIRFAVALGACLTVFAAVASRGAGAAPPPGRGSTPTPAVAPVDPGRLALTALELDFQRGGVSASAETVAERYAAACAAGHAVSCQWQTWHAADTPMLGLAAAAHRPACEAGDAVACLVVAWDDIELARGQLHVTPPRPDRHAALITRAIASTTRLCAGGLKAACADLGLLQAGRYGGDARVELAVATWRGACAGGDARSCAFLTTVPGGVTPAEERAFADRACALGALDVCFARIRGTDPFEEPDEARRASFLRLCRQGLVAACGAPKLDPAPEGVEEACRLRHAQSCADRARDLVDAGEPDKALESTRRACRAFVGLCSMYLGSAMERERGLCGGGDTAACARLAAVPKTMAPLLKEQERYLSLTEGASAARLSQLP